jgi:hypothetical protein
MQQTHAHLFLFVLKLRFCKPLYFATRDSFILWRVDPLLGKDLVRNNEERAVSEQRGGKYVPADTNMHATIEVRSFR